METSYGTVISSEDCAVGSLNRITSKAVYGGDFHEFHGVLIENILLDFLPINFQMKMMSPIVKNIIAF